MQRIFGLATVLPAVLPALLLGGCADDGGGAPSAGGWGGGRPATLVVTKPAEVRRIADVVEAIGTAQANESVTITAKVTDAIRQVRFDDGDFAEAGDVLVELTNAEQTAQLAEAEAAVRDAQAQYERLEDLLGQGSVPVSDVDEARARLSGAVARHQAVVARLDDRLIQAPFTGLLGFRQVSAGTLITPGTAITTLDDISIIKLDFSIAEVHLAVVRPGLELTVESAAFPGKEFDAEVKTIGSRVNPVTRAAPVRAHIENADALLRPGMLMTVKLATASREALMVPETALQQRGADTYVYTVADGKAVMTAVDLGIRRGGWAEILSGLASGQEVVTEGVLKIRNGIAVRTAADGPARRPSG